MLLFADTGILTFDTELGSLNENLDSQSDVLELIKAAHDTHDAIMRTETVSSDLWQKVPTKDYRKLVAAQDVMANIVEKYLQVRL